MADDQSPEKKSSGPGRRGCGCLAVLIVFYVGLYSLLSWNGSYTRSASGAFRALDIAIPDQQEWMPAKVVFHSERTNDHTTVVEANWPGWIFAPAVIVDRWLVHPTRTLDQQNEALTDRLRRLIDDAQKKLESLKPGSGK